MPLDCKLLPLLCLAESASLAASLDAAAHVPITHAALASCNGTTHIGASQPSTLSVKSF